jgi:hypothetical protein
MADETPPSPQTARPETAHRAEARAAEAAAIRRRWITLGEILAVLAVLISAGTLWLNWSQRSDDAATRVAESRKASSRAAQLVLNAATDGDERLTLKPASADQVVQSLTIRFPSALKIAAVGTTGNPRIEVQWFDDGLKRARGKAGLPDNSRGDERLPIMIETRFLVDGEAHDDIALYDIGYTIVGRLLTGHRVTLRGLSLVKRATNDNAQAQLDARWAKLVPAVRVGQTDPSQD